MVTSLGLRIDDYTSIRIHTHWTLSGCHTLDPSPLPSPWINQMCIHRHVRGTHGLKSVVVLAPVTKACTEHCVLPMFLLDESPSEMHAEPYCTLCQCYTERNYKSQAMCQLNGRLDSAGSSAMISVWLNTIRCYKYMHAHNFNLLSVFKFILHIICIHVHRTTYC